MPLIFDVEGVGSGNSNLNIVGRIPLGVNVVATSVAVVFQSGGPVSINVVVGEGAEGGVAGNGVTAVAGNQFFTTDAGQVATTPGVVYNFEVPTSAIYPEGVELTLRAVTTAAGVGGLKVIVYTTADSYTPVVEGTAPPPTDYQPLIFDVAGIGENNTNANIVARIPLAVDTVIAGMSVVFAGGGPISVNVVSGESAESGVVAGNGAYAVSGNQVFALDSGQACGTAGDVYNFTPPTTAIYPAGSELTLRVVTGGAAGVTGLKVALFTYALAEAPSLPTPVTAFNPLDYQPQRFYPFGIPYQPLGQWIQYDPTSGAYTFTISPGFTLGSIYFPNLTAPVEIFAGPSYTSPATPFYTTGSGGGEVVPLPSGLTSITLYAPSLAGAIMAVFITSSILDPQKSTPSSAAVSSVSATAPLFATLGANPVVSMELPLPVEYGGTGTVTPSLVAGSNITITGTWPNQTINATVTFPYVQTVTAAAPLTSSGGLNPSIALTTPLAVNYGGTGSTAPSLVGGTGITITGTWPNQTIALTSSYLPVYDYNTSAYIAGAYLVIGTATTATGGAVTIASGFPHTCLIALPISYSPGTVYVIIPSITGASVTFTAYTTSGTATPGVAFFFVLIGY